MKLVIETETKESVVSMVGILDEHAGEIADAIHAGAKSGILHNDNLNEEATWELVI